MKTAARNVLLGALLSVAGFIVCDAHAGAAADRAEDLSWAVKLFERYPIVRKNITYYTADNYEAKLDVYAPHGDGKPRPTLLFIHGGGWMSDYTKDTFPFIFLPFLQIGWNVVNVDYRPASVSLAPAAVEDCLCALRWVGRNASELNIDTGQLVIMGQSAGGLLALTTGMIPASPSGLGGPCVYADAYGPPPDSIPALTVPPRPAAIVNWSGITDVADVLQGPGQRSFAAMWLGNQPDRMSIAKQVSPLSYVRTGLPPIVSIYGDKDPLVPYAQAVRLHDALTKAAVRNELITMHGSGHGLFGVEAARDAWMRVFSFLEKAGLNMQPE